MKTKKLKSWLEFQSKVVDPFCTHDNKKGVPLWFRGQCNSAWTLQTTLDRYKVFSSDLERSRIYRNLLRSFREEIVGIDANRIPDGDGLELLARHHGLPSTLLDWSRSPYVAAFFAFETALDRTGPEFVSIWALDCEKIAVADEIELIEDRKLLWYNHRALEQAGVFIRVNSVLKPTEEFLESALANYDIPADDARIAMRYLEAMNINARILFRDLDGAARAVKTRNQS